MVCHHNDLKTPEPKIRKTARAEVIFHDKLITMPSEQTQNDVPNVYAF